MHYAVLLDTESKIESLVKNIFEENLREFDSLKDKNGFLFSALAIERFMDEEERHGIKTLSKHGQSLKSMSSGEQKKALLNHILDQKPDFIVLHNPFDNLDIQSQKALRNHLVQIAQKIVLLQLITRIDDMLPITTHYFSYHNSKLKFYVDKQQFVAAHQIESELFKKNIPKPLAPLDLNTKELVRFEDVTVRFENRTVLNQINWSIKKGEFWQLVGPNGSGKSTLLNMITGDSHKGYGQNLTVFGNKKGSGESVWDLKKYIGYFTPAMTDKFKGYHSLENMLISGLHDSIGLYTRPSIIEKKLAQEWLAVVGLEPRKDAYFHQLSLGQKRLIMLLRAMVKHPPLLILDEPTAGLDDANAQLFLNLVNKIANETASAIIYVSHRFEKGLNPDVTYQLTMTDTGSIGRIV